MALAAAQLQTYNPKIRKGATLYSVPTPLMTREETYDRRITSVEIPLSDGVGVFDVRRGALLLACQGILHVDQSSGEGPSDLQVKIDALEDALVGSNSVSGFTFYTHYDSTLGNYRYYANALCREFSIQHTSRTRVYVPFSFTLLIPGGKAHTVTGQASPPDATTGYTEIIEGPLHIQLEDSDATGALYIQNSDGDYVAKIDSEGNLYYTGMAIQVDSITGPDG